MISEAEIAPVNMSGNVRSLCTLRTDLSAVPESAFTRLVTSKGMEFLGLDFVLEIIVDSAGLMFELKVEGVSALVLGERVRVLMRIGAIWVCYGDISLSG